MKQLLLFICFCGFLFCASCNSNSSESCHIVGTLPDAKYNGKCIYLIAEDNSIREEVGIDSCFIEDQKFEFTTNKQMLQILRLDFHFRYGIQDLLVVTEPGEVFVTIDSVSSASGTVSNDALQQWKNMTEVKTSKSNQLRQFMIQANQVGDSITANKLQIAIDSIGRDYRRSSRALADKLEDGPLKTFLLDNFPTSYKRKMPDGSIKEFPLD